jgi:fused signal recognition particle receptor
MVFNWFRRQHNDSSPSTTPEPQQSETPLVQEQPQSESSTTATPTDTTPQDLAAQDLLAYAKAAYKNIKQKSEHVETPAGEQIEETPVVEASAISPTAEELDKVSEETAVAALVEVAEQPEATSLASPESVVETVEQPEATSVTSPESVVETAEQPEATSLAGKEGVAEIAEQPEATSLASTESDAQLQPTEPSATEQENKPTTNLSFLERAAAERQAKQERLIATAIDVPEPEAPQPVVTTAATATPEITEEIPGLAFDEGFLWSTEVLAAQGRLPEDISPEEITWLKKLRQGLDKTRRNVLNQLKAIVGQGPLNQAAVEEIESVLLQADVGVEATDYIINTLQQKLRQEVLPPEAAIAYLKQILQDMLDAPVKKSQKPIFAPEKETLNIWLITGVNGAGKTTTIGKIAHLSQKSGYKTLIGAADTFRAAAVEQVKIWGQRSGVEVIANPGKNTDPAAVVFDAITAAQSRNTELLLVDTAGRLQNKKNLMDELSKIRRIIDKKSPDAKVESLLVLDATLGQNGLRQAEVFSQAAQLSGVVLTKLDSTAKGGVALAVVQQLGLPIRFIGAGEGIEDLRPFSSYEFVEALLSG